MLVNSKNLLEKIQISYKQFIMYLEEYEKNDNIADVTVQIRNITEIPDGKDCILKPELLSKIITIRLFRLDVKAHQFAFKNFPNFRDLKNLQLSFPTKEENGETFDFDLIKKTFFDLYQLDSLQSLDLELHFAESGHANKFLEIFLYEGTSIKTKKLTISPVEFVEGQIYNKEKAKKLTECSRTSNLSLYMMGDNIKHACQNLSILQALCPRLEHLDIDFLPDESTVAPTMRNAAQLGEFVMFTFLFPELKTYRLNLQTIDIRGLQDYLHEEGVKKHPKLESLTIPEFTDNYMWVEEIDKKIRISNDDLDSLDELWHRFPNLKKCLLN